MELLYVWIDHFKKFDTSGFNFSSEFNFTSNYSKNDDEQESLEIILSRKDNYIRLFPKEFSNITGIVGANASGKTSLLQVLKLLSGPFQTLDSRVVFCYRLEDNPYRIYTVHNDKGKRGDEIAVSIDQSTENVRGLPQVDLVPPITYTFRNVKGMGFNQQEIFFEGREKSLEQVTGIFFTNSFELHYEELFSDIINLSTNYLLDKYTKDFFNDLKGYSKDTRLKRDDLLNRETPQSRLFEVELKQQIDFITFANQNKLYIPELLPGSLSLLFNKEDYSFLSINKHLQWSKEDIAVIDKRGVEEIETTKDPEKRILALITLLGFYYCLRQDLFSKTNFKSLKSVNDKLKEIAQSDKVIESIKHFFKEVTPQRGHKFSEIKAIVNGSLEKALKKNTYTNSEGNPYRFEFETGPSLWEFIRMILDFKFLSDRPFIDYKWYGLSSGQDALLKQFARFNSIKDDVGTGVLWIMIDEGDLYFHPEWQKEYLSNLISILPHIFKNKSIQLFLSSHSPFVVSDMPRNHLILLSTEGVVSNNPDLKQTFGSNIHSLFRNSFFLTGMLGDFAKSMIDAGIKKLNGEHQDVFTSWEEVQTLILNIGEPLIKGQMQKMLDSKRILRVEEELINLTSRIDKLEQNKS